MKMGNLPKHPPTISSTIFLSSEKDYSNSIDDNNNLSSSKVSRDTCHMDIKKVPENTPERYEVLLSSLRVKLPINNNVVIKEEEEEGGWKTPTSPENKIPMSCPPAPRKPKPSPVKRRKGCEKRVFLDFSVETEALFPPLVLADLGKKIKKIRTTTANNNSVL